MNTNNNLVCPSCRDYLIEDNASAAYSCPSCKTAFPILEHLPILIMKPEHYIAKVYFEYHNHLSEQYNTIKTLNMMLDSHRGKAIKKILHGIEHNQHFFQELSAIFEKVVNPKILLDIVKANSSVRYFTNLDYMIKDWIKTDSTTEKIKQISSCINNSLRKINKTYDSVLYLGAGTCRLSSELQLGADNLWYVDYSYTMGYFYKQLTVRNLSFYKVSLKNNEKVSQVAENIDISMNNYQKTKAKSSYFNYVIGDALQMPFPSAKFDLVLSIYFTDVVSIKRLINEIKRVLRPGGTFLHFGPLDYHTKNIEEMLSYEELVTMLQEENFEIELEDDVISNNGSNMGRLCRKEYTNKLLIAKYLGEELRVDFNSVYNLKEDISFRIEGKIGKSCLIHMESQGYNFDQRSVHASFELLKRLDGKSMLEDIIADLQCHFKLDREFNSQVTHLIEALLEKGILEKQT